MRWPEASVHALYLVEALPEVVKRMYAVDALTCDIDCVAGKVTGGTGKLFTDRCCVFLF